MAEETVLVTGASGFIAKHCILTLLARGFRVRGTLRRPEVQGPALKQLVATHGHDASRLEFIRTDLMSDEGWEAAVTGTVGILHVASPFPMRQPRNIDEVVRPARTGALRVLKAAKRAGIRRVVMTSSIVAVMFPVGPAPDRKLDERDWTDPKRRDLSAYILSKTLAERAAWDYVGGEGKGLELVTVNPGFVLGPALDDDLSTSLEAVRRMARGYYPAVPPVTYPIADARDVAEMHVTALLHQDAAGERFLCAEGDATFYDIARTVGATLPDVRWKLPRLEAPEFIIRAAALVDSSLKTVVPSLGGARRIENAKAKTRLGFQFRTPEDAAAEAARSLRRLRLI